MQIYLLPFSTHKFSVQAFTNFVFSFIILHYLCSITKDMDTITVHLSRLTVATQHPLLTRFPLASDFESNCFPILNFHVFVEIITEILFLFCSILQPALEAGDKSMFFSFYLFVA
jgi:hypothetical protein